MIKLHLLIASAILIVGILAKSTTATIPQFECQDAKDKLVHVGKDKEGTCERLEKKDKKFVKKACKVKIPSSDGAPPAKAMCRKTCDNCSPCKKFYTTFIDYYMGSVYTYPQGCNSTITDGYVCVGTTVALQPLPLYFDKNMTKYSGAFMFGTGSFFTEVNTMFQGAIFFDSPAAAVKKFSAKHHEAFGDMHFSAVTDIYSDSVPATITGGTGMLGLVSGSGEIFFEGPDAMMPKGLVTAKICPVFPEMEK